MRGLGGIRGRLVGQGDGRTTRRGLRPPSAPAETGKPYDRKAACGHVSPDELPAIDFEKGDGLVPCIAQDARTGRVLMLAYVNQEALEATLETGRMHYWSRSRQQLWQKGETSGHVQRVVALSHDCDADALLALVHQEGPACHTGTRTCWTGRGFQGTSTEPILAELDAVIADRAEALPEGSWTTKLLTEDRLAEAKVLEEAQEVVDRAEGQGEDPLAHELADLIYHALVLARKHGLGLEDILAELETRRG